MVIGAARRLLVIGNSGSGKSTLARQLGKAWGLSICDLDLLHWHDDGSKRDEAEAKTLVATAAAGEAWVIEGVYGWLAAVALARATALIWLDLPWEACQAGLLQRGLRRGMTQADEDALLAWAAAYRTRTTPSSFMGHERLFHGFSGDKARLRTRAAITTFEACVSSGAASPPGGPVP